MNARHSRRRGLTVLATAAGSAALAMWGASEAPAGLMIDLRAEPGSGYTVSNGGKQFILNSFGPTITVSIGVFARLSGTNAAQEIGNFDGLANDLDTRNDDMLQTVIGSFSSTGSLLGNMSANPAGAPVSYDARVIPFNGSASSNGVANDFDSDGDLDIGALGTDPSQMWVVRANTPTQATLFNGNTSPTKGWSQGPDGGAIPGPNTNDTIIDATTQELQIGRIRFITSGSTITPNNLAVAVNYIPRALAPFPSIGALWFEDGLLTGKFPGAGVFTVGAPVTHPAVIPEPVGVALASLMSIGLLRRRSDRTREA
jgi:hypothetical protein